MLEPFQDSCSPHPLPASPTMDTNLLLDTDSWVAASGAITTTERGLPSPKLRLRGQR
jgi:hypothetical protein